MKKEIMIFSTPGGSNYFYELYKKTKETKPVGVDWAKDSGMNRGDVIQREGSVIHVRFKTLGV